MSSYKSAASKTTRIPNLSETMSALSLRRTKWHGLLWTAGALCVVAGHVAEAQEMQYPLSAAVADDGTVYVADRNFHGIWKISNGSLEQFFQGSAKFRTPLNAVRCVAMDHNGKLLAGDSSTREVYRFDDSGKPVPLTNGGIGVPTAIAVRKNGEILVADQELQFVWKVPASGGDPVKLAEVPGVVGLCLDADDQLWVTSRSKYQLRRVDPDGTVENVLTDRPFQFPQYVAVDADKTAYVTDNYAKAVWKVELGKSPVKLVEGKPLVNPVGIVRHSDKLLVTDPRAKAIFQIDSAGKVTVLYPKS
jgi:outer membrane protein assembly factor BamB